MIHLVYYFFLLMCLNFYYYGYYLFEKNKYAFGFHVSRPSLRLVFEKVGPMATVHVLATM